MSKQFQCDSQGEAVSTKIRFEAKSPVGTTIQGTLTTQATGMKDLDLEIRDVLVETFGIDEDLVDQFELRLLGDGE
jgi:hypothetical protein